jgi:hypothetical protein
MNNYKSPTGVRDVVLGLFTTANQRFSRLVYNTSETTNLLSRSVFNHKPFVLIFSSNWTEHAVDNTQQLFFAIIYLKKFVLAVVVALPSYMLSYSSCHANVNLAQTWIWRLTFSSAWFSLIKASICLWASGRVRCIKTTVFYLGQIKFVLNARFSYKPCSHVR